MPSIERVEGSTASYFIVDLSPFPVAEVSSDLCVAPFNTAINNTINRSTPFDVEAFLSDDEKNKNERPIMVIFRTTNPSSKTNNNNSASRRDNNRRAPVEIQMTTRFLGYGMALSGPIHRRKDFSNPYSEIPSIVYKSSSSSSST